MTALALALPPAAPTTDSIRWDRVAQARTKLNEGDYDRLSDAHLDALLQAVLDENPGEALAG